MNQEITVAVDGKQLELPSNTEGVIVLNLNSNMGGSNPWGRPSSKKFSQQTTDDGLFEVVAVGGSFHLGAIKAHLSSATRLAQGKEMTINILQNDIACQYDGEPWLQPPCTIHISHLNKAKMLMKSKK